MRARVGLLAVWLTCNGCGPLFIEREAIWTDSSTGYSWQNPALRTMRTWEGAGAYCSFLQWGDRSDWAFPTVDEMLTLVEATPEGCGWKDGLYGECADYWSATQEAGDTMGVRFDIGSGRALPIGVSGKARVRCIVATPVHE